MKMQAVMGMVYIVTWRYLINSYVTYDFFMDIWGFNKEEIISHYKVLEKIHGNGLKKNITAQIYVGLMEGYQQRGDDTQS